MLPSHNDCFYGLHARLDHLLRSQDRSLERLRRALGEPRRAVEVFAALFARRVGEEDMSQMSVATGESLACLNYLIERGEVKRELRDDGANWYSLIESERRDRRIAPCPDRRINRTVRYARFLANCTCGRNRGRVTSL